MTLPKMSLRQKSSLSSKVDRQKQLQQQQQQQNVTTEGSNKQLEELCVEQQFRILKTISEGRFSKTILVRKDTDKLVLKAFDSRTTSYEDFKKEMDYNYFLSPHPNILKSFNVSFILDNYFVGVMEYAGFYGPLSRFINGKRSNGLQESQVKIVAQQLASALEFMHSVNLVHGDVTLDNVLVVGPSLSYFKLGDFGSTRPVGSLVKKMEHSTSMTNMTTVSVSMSMSISTSLSPVSSTTVSSSSSSTTTSSCCTYPPEVCQIIPQEKYYCYTSFDVWQVGILICQCLTGSEPWQMADITDYSYNNFVEWHKKKSIRVPEPFSFYTPRLCRLMKRLLEPKSTKRCEIKEINKYLNDKWISRETALASSRTSLQKSESSVSKMSRKSSSSRSMRQRSSAVRSASSVRLVKFNENCVFVDN